jgi:hypothetical protein
LDHFSARNQYVVILIGCHEAPTTSVAALRAACLLLRPQWKNFSGLAHRLSHRRCDTTSNLLRSSPQRVRIQVRVALGRARLGVAEQLADDGKTKASTCTVPFTPRDRPLKIQRKNSGFRQQMLARNWHDDAISPELGSFCQKSHFDCRLISPLLKVARGVVRSFSKPPLDSAGRVEDARGSLGHATRR